MPESGRVVVCDQDPHTRAFVCHIGKAIGFDVMEASDGRQALAALIVGDVHFGFLDLALPELSAYEVAYRIKQMHLQRPPILVAMTSDQSMHQAAVEFDAFIRKPVDAEGVAKILMA